MDGILGTLLEIGKYSAPAVVVGGFLWRNQKLIINTMRNREFDTILTSATYAGELIEVGQHAGYRKLYFDTLGTAETFDSAVRGRKIRSIMDKCAKRCSWHADRRFILVGSAHESEMVRVMRNYLSRHFPSSVTARFSGVDDPETAEIVLFSVTGADSAQGQRKFYRIILMMTHDVETFLNHPTDKWLYQDDKNPELWHADTTHPSAVRLQTVRKMAMHYTENQPLIVDGEPHQIVHWMRG